MQARGGAAGLAPRARKDIQAEVDAGRFDIENAQMTARVLCAFGMSKRDADKLCAGPIPPQPTL